MTTEATMRVEMLDAERKLVTISYPAECEMLVTASGALIITEPRTKPGPLKKLAAYSQWVTCEVI